MDGLLSDRYELHEVLGTGSLGVVYRAFDRRLEREVALKTLASPRPEDLLLLKREFRAIADTLHPNLVRLHDLEVSEELAFFTMELVAGAPILGVVANGAPRATDPEAVRAAFEQLATGLAALHDTGLLHRDIKPANVLMEGSGRVVLLDFGLVVGGTHELSLQSREQLAGTLAYMAPEQAWGHDVREPADWYAVGVMLYECLEGRLPFEGPSLASLLDRQDQEVAAPKGPAAEQDPALARLALDLLAFDPAARPGRVEILGRLRQREPGTPAERVAPRTRARFVNREDERESLLRGFERTRRGRPAVAWVHGRAGIGKSALVEHVLVELERERNALVLRSRCHPQANVRFEALDGCVDELSRFLVQLDDAEREALRPRGVPALLRVFPVLSRVPFEALEAEFDPGDADPALSRRAGFAALRELLARIATRRPLVLWIDDLQWGDADSAPFLNELANDADAPPALLVFSYRGEDLEQGPLLRGLDSRRADESSSHLRIEMGSLDQAYLAELIGTAQSLAPDAERVQALAAQADGSPLFALALSDYADRRLEPAGTIELQDVLAERLDSLTPDTSDLMGWVAVAGRPVETKLVLDLSEDGPKGRPGIYELCRRGWLRPIPGEDRVDVLHARFREVMIGRLGEREVKRRHREMGSALLASPNADPSRIYEHFRVADDEAAADWSLKAAEDAEARLAFDRAAELFDEAHALRGRRSDGWTLLERRAKALAAGGRSASAAAAFRVAAAAAREAGAETLDEVMLRGHAAEQHLYAGELEPGTELLHEVLDSLGVRRSRSVGASQRRALISRARFLLRDLSGGVERSLRRRTPPSEDALVRLDLIHGACRGLSMLDPVFADALTAEQLMGAIRLGEPSRLVRALGLQAGFEANVGGPWLRRHAHQLLDRIDRLADETGVAFDRAWALMSRSNIAWLDGEWRECVERGHETIEWLTSRCVGIQWERTSNDLFTLSALAQIGELQELRRRAPAMLEAARQRGDAFGVMTVRTGDAAFVALADDDVERAALEIQEAGRPYGGGPFTSIDYYHLYPWVQLLIYRGDAGAGFTDLQAAWPALERAGFHRLDCIGNGMRHLRARAALAAARRSEGGERERYLSVAAGDARRIARSTLPHTAGLAAAVRAGIAGLRGQEDERRVALEQTAEVLTRQEMLLYAAAARRQLGRLLGGDRGRELLAEGDAVFEQEGVRNPDAFEELLLPGDPDLGR